MHAIKTARCHGCANSTLACRSASSHVSNCQRWRASGCMDDAMLPPLQIIPLFRKLASSIRAVSRRSWLSIPGPSACEAHLYETAFVPGALRERCRERVVGNVHSLGTPGSLNRFAECPNGLLRRGNARVFGYTRIYVCPSSRSDILLVTWMKFGKRGGSSFPSFFAEEAVFSERTGTNKCIDNIGL